MAALALALACESPPPPPAPPPSTAGARPTSPSTSLLKSRQGELSELERAKSEELERTLASISGVTSARVHVVLARPASLLGDVPAESGKASVLLQHQGASPPLPKADIQALVASATRGILPSDVLVVTRTAAPLETAPSAPALVRFGPIAVEQRSAGWARIVLGAAAVTGLALTAVLIGLWVALRRQGRHPSRLPISAPPGVTR